MTYEQNYMAISGDGGLVHYGVPKMKWGVRRYQDVNGKLTELGKKHYGNNYTKKESADKIINDLRSVISDYEKTDASRFKGQVRLNKMEKKQSAKPNEKRQQKIDEYKDVIEKHKTQMNNLAGLQGKILQKAAEQNNTRAFKKKMAKLNINSSYFNNVSKKMYDATVVKRFLKSINS